MALSTEAKSIIIGIILAVATASSAPWWWKYVSGGNDNASPPGVVGFSGGCDAFQVFAQNRWQPYGAAVRAQPNVNSKIEMQYGGDVTFDVNGWVASRPAYPTNHAPWNSDVWFHMADDSGWVSFAAVRAWPTSHDPTGQKPDGGKPVPTTANCEGSIQ